MQSTWSRAAQQHMLDMVLAHPEEFMEGDNDSFKLTPYFNDVVGTVESTLDTFDKAVDHMGYLTNSFMYVNPAACVRAANDNGETTIYPSGEYRDTVGTGTSTLGLSVYGLVIEDQSGTNYMGAIRFNEPVPLAVDGQVIQFPWNWPLALECGGIGD